MLINIFRLVKDIDNSLNEIKLITDQSEKELSLTIKKYTKIARDFNETIKRSFHYKIIILR